jgi:hypothetical protein
MQHRPEAVAGAREVMARRRRHQARVDAAEQDLEAARDHVGDDAVAGRLQFCLGEAGQRIAPGA